MRSFFVAVVLVGALHATAAAELQHAELTAPRDWTSEPVADEHLAESRKAPGVVRADGVVWVAPDGDGELVLMELVQRRIGRNVRAQIRGLENGIRKSMPAGQQLELREEDNGVHVFVHQTVQLEDRRVRMHRRYVVTRDAIHVAIASCVGAGPAPSSCEPALGTLRLAVPGAEELPSDDPAYRLGYAFGQLLAFGAIGLLVVYLVRSSRRRERERVAAARRERERVAGAPPPPAS